VIDAALCHGAVGVAQIFFRMHQETTIPELHDAYQYWNQVTLQFSYHKDGLAGYKSYKVEEGWVNEYSVLEGIAEIGLSLLPPVDADWDEICAFNSLKDK